MVGLDRASYLFAARNGPKSGGGRGLAVWAKGAAGASRLCCGGEHQQPCRRGKRTFRPGLGHFTSPSLQLPELCVGIQQLLLEGRRGCCRRRCE